MQLDDGDGEGFEDEANSQTAGLSKLIDIRAEPMKKGKGTAGGRPKKNLLDKLLQKCYHSDKPEQHLFHCTGGCGTTFSNRNLDRAIKHARACSKLPSELRKIAKEHATKSAPSEKLLQSKNIQSKIGITDYELCGNDADDAGKVVVKKRKISPDTAVITLDALVEEARSLS